MISVLLVVVVHAAIFIVAGVPLAFALRTRAGGWGWLVVDALLYGLIAVTLAVTLFAWIGWAGPVLVFALLAAAAWRAASERIGFPARWRPSREGWLLAAGYAVVIVGAVALRLREVNFIQWVGDMGAYVNWANEFIRTGVLSASWPPYFSSYLTISTAIFGPALTTAAVPLAGLALVLVVARVARSLGAGPWASLLAAALVTVSVHGIWYSSFPSSESLNAPIFIVWIGTLIGAMRAERRQLASWLVWSAVVLVALGLLRGTAPLLLLPLFVLVVLSVVVPNWRTFGVRLWLLFGASVVATLVTYWYGISRITRYYVTTQVHDLLPAPVFRLFGNLGLFQPTVRTALALVIVSALACSAGVYVARRFADRARETKTPAILAIVLSALLALGVAAGAVINAEVWHIILRAGLWLVLAAVLLFVLTNRAARAGLLTAESHVVILFIGAVIAIFVAIQSYRLRGERGHAFFLYWDRYLVSEVIPLLFLSFALVVTVVYGLYRRRFGQPSDSKSPRLVRMIPAAASIVLVAVAVIPTLGQVALVERDTYMKGAYEFETALMALAPDRSEPVAWSANSAGQAPGYFFPNTWMAFAKPMQRSFGYSVVNLSGRPNDFAPDIVYTKDSLLTLASCSTHGHLVVFETDLGGKPLDQRIATPGISIVSLGTRTSDISLLSQPPVHGWTRARISVAAWDVTVSADLLNPSTCSP